MPTILSNRQETFCRHYAVSDNAAAAARASGYSEICARQQGYENLHKPFVQIRLDEIRRGFAETAGREAAILLSRLELVWPIAAAAGNAHTMLMTLGMEAKLSGLFGNADTKVRLWGPDGQAGPLERAVAHAGDTAALAAAEFAAPRDPELAHRRLAAPARTFSDEPEPEGIEDYTDLYWHEDAVAPGPYGDGLREESGYDGSPYDEGSFDGEPFDGEPSNGEPCDGKLCDGELSDGATADVSPAADEAPAPEGPGGAGRRDGMPGTAAAGCGTATGPEAAGEAAAPPPAGPGGPRRALPARQRDREPHGPADAATGPHPHPLSPGRRGEVLPDLTEPDTPAGIPA
ncbi:MAG: terminase small subunit [Bauldia litoralis]